MSVKYICKECQKENKKGTICEFCFGQVERIIEKKVKKENPMNKEKAIKFIKSQRYVNGFKNRPVYEKYNQLLDFINKAIPDENQEQLF